MQNHPTSGNDDDDDDDDEKDREMISEKETRASRNCDCINRYLFRVWTWSIDAAADIVSSILTHPKVQKASADFMTHTLHRVLDDPTTIEKVDAMTSRLSLDMRRHSETARAIGKDTPMLVSGFVGGLMSNVRKNKKDEIVTVVKKDN